MPYRVQRRAGEYVVISLGTRRILGRHRTRTDAERQQRLLYAQKIKEQKSNQFSVFKDSSGRLRWVTISSTSYMDRDGEIVSLKALKEDVDCSDATGFYGPLKWWHVDTLNIGYCDFRIVIGKALLESGLFFTDEIGHKLGGCSNLLGVSIGFTHPPDQPVKGVYECIRTQERSILPRYAASNLFTRVGIF